MLDDNDLDANTNSSTPQLDPVESQSQSVVQTPPPAGDSEKAEKYLKQLISLIDQDKLEIIHTDLKKFDIASIQDHYRIDLKDYEVEINHSKQPDTGQDLYIMLFNNIKKIEEAGQSCINKVILAYTHLTKSQFEEFKEASDSALERKRKKEEAKRFAEAMAPIDNVLGSITSANQVDEPKKTSELSEEKSGPEEIDQDVDLADFATEPDDSDEPKASDFQSSSTI